MLCWIITQMPSCLDSCEACRWRQSVQNTCVRFGSCLSAQACSFSHQSGSAACWWAAGLFAVLPLSPKQGGGGGAVRRPSAWTGRGRLHQPVQGANTARAPGGCAGASQPQAGVQTYGAHLFGGGGHSSQPQRCSRHRYLQELRRCPCCGAGASQAPAGGQAGGGDLLGVAGQGRRRRG